MRGKKRVVTGNAEFRKAREQMQKEQKESGAASGGGMPDAHFVMKAPGR